MSVRIQRTIARQNRFSSLGEHLSEPKKRFYFIYIVEVDILKSGPEFRNIFSQYARIPRNPASCAAGICRNVQEVGQKGQMNWCI